MNNISEMETQLLVTLKFRERSVKMSGRSLVLRGGRGGDRPWVWMRASVDGREVAENSKPRNLEK